MKFDIFLNKNQKFLLILITFQFKDIFNSLFQTK